jgi:hypothetical protein
VWNEKSASSEAAANKEGAMFGGAQKWCIRVCDGVLVCVGFEVGVSLGCGFALRLRDEWIGPCPYTDRYTWTRDVGRVGWVSICYFVG